MFSLGVHMCILMFISLTCVCLVFISPGVHPREYDHVPARV